MNCLYGSNLLRVARFPCPLASCILRMSHSRISPTCLGKSTPIPNPYFPAIEQRWVKTFSRLISKKTCNYWPRFRTMFSFANSVLLLKVCITGIPHSQFSFAKIIQDPFHRESLRGLCRTVNFPVVGTLGSLKFNVFMSHVQFFKSTLNLGHFYLQSTDAYIYFIKGLLKKLNLRSYCIRFR